MIRLPDECPRGLDSCSPLSQVVSDSEPRTFCCCGISDIDTRKIPEDKFRHCWVSETVDEIGDYDECDIKDTIWVLAQALSIQERLKEQ